MGLKVGAFIRLPEHGRPISDRGSRSGKASFPTLIHDRFSPANVDISGLEPDPKWTLRTQQNSRCVSAPAVLLVTSFTASALFAPKRGKPGYEIAVKEAAQAAEAAPAPSEPIEAFADRLCREGAAAARNAPPALPSRRAAPTASGLICTASSATIKARTRVQFLRRAEGQGRHLDDDDLNRFITNPKGLFRAPRWIAGISKDSERADVIAYLHTLDNPVPLPTASVTARHSGPSRDQRPGFAWPFALRLARLLSGRFAAAGH
jgi:cytochrome c